MSERWRVGRKVGRTLYRQLGDEPSDDDPLIGVMDTPELAAMACAAMAAGPDEATRCCEHNHLNSGIYGGCPACGTDYPELRDWAPGTGRHDPMSEPPEEQR